MTPKKKPAKKRSSSIGDTKVAIAHIGGDWKVVRKRTSSR